MLCIYGSMYVERGIQGWCPRLAPSTNDLCNTEMGAMKAEGHARLKRPTNPGYKYVGYCMRGTERRAQGACGHWGLYGGGHPEGVP